MKIEKLNEDKIRITLNMEDLKDKNVDFHSFMANPIESQSLFLEMLDAAEKEVGFTTENYRISIEAIALSNGSFIFTVTRVQEKTVSEKKPVHTRKKENANKTGTYIYEFEEFDDFSEFCKYFDKSIIGKEKEFYKNNYLYFLNEKYYLVIKCEKIDPMLIQVFNSMIIEFAKPIQRATLIEGKIKEFGKIVIKNNALKTPLRYF